MALSSHERVSELIGRIYDCVLDPEAWTAALEDIRAEFGFANALLAVNALSGRAEFYAYSRLIPGDLKRATDLYGAEVMTLWGGDRIAFYPVGEPIVLSRLCPRETVRGSRYYREWCAPRDLGDALTIRVTDDPLVFGNVTLGQSESLGDVTDEQIDHMRLLAPHLRRAVTISHVLDNKAMETATFAAVVDVLQAAVVLVDEECGIVYANPAAQAMLAKGEPIQDRRGTVTVATEMVRNALLTAVHQAANDETEWGERGIGIPIRQSTGDPAVIHVLPLRHGTLRAGLDQRAVAALFVIPTTKQSQMPRDALVLLYDLTPAEVRVCEMIIRGEPPREIAVMLGVSVNTVRSHLARVFDKTGTKRQVDLVSLVSSLTLRL